MKKNSIWIYWDEAQRRYPIYKYLSWNEFTKNFPPDRYNKEKIMVNVPSNNYWNNYVKR